MGRVLLLLCVVLGGCSVPELKDPPNVLSVPPNLSEIPQDNGKLAGLDPGGDEQHQLEVETSDRGRLARDGMLSGENTSGGLVIDDGDGLICAGRSASVSHTLHLGEAVPVACSDGRLARLLVRERDMKGILTATLTFDNSAPKSVRIVDR